MPTAINVLIVPPGPRSSKLPHSSHYCALICEGDVTTISGFPQGCASALARLRSWRAQRQAIEQASGIVFTRRIASADAVESEKKPDLDEQHRTTLKSVNLL
jgi:hypothetical protein